VDKSLEIKISTLIKRVESLEKNVMIMIRILNPDLDSNYENIKNKQKYAASFLPPQIKQAEVRPADDEKAFGYPLETLNAAAEKLSKPVIDNLIAQDETLKSLTTKLLGGKLPKLVKLKLAKEALDRGLIQP